MEGIKRKLSNLKLKVEEVEEEKIELVKERKDFEDQVEEVSCSYSN